MDFMKNPKYLRWLCIAVAYLALFFCAVFVLRLVMRRRGVSAERARLVELWILRGLCILLLATEFYKYLMLLHNDGRITHGNFPMQLCSIPLYIFPVAAFGNPSRRAASWFMSASLAIGLMGGIATIVFPNNVIFVNQPWFANGFATYSTISVIFHTTMVIFAAYMLITRRYSPRGADIFKAMAVFAGFTVIALGMNAIVPGGSYMMYGDGGAEPFISFGKNYGHTVMVLLMIVAYYLAFLIIFAYWVVRDLLRFYWRRREGRR
jgi:hypothetical protein